MDDVVAVWDEFNRRHLTEDHPERALTLAEIEEAMSDPKRIEDQLQRADGAYGVVVGRTAGGRLLYVSYVTGQPVVTQFTLARLGENSKGSMRPVNKPGTQFGPEPHQYDPFDNMTDDEIEAELGELFKRQRASVTISIRMPSDLLDRTKRVAAEGGIAYQTLIKRLVDAGVTRLEHRPKHRSA